MKNWQTGLWQSDKILSGVMEALPAHIQVLHQ
jgi:hypothetical protein